MRITIVGGGVFGVAAARSIARRGHDVELFEATAVPGDNSASRDISKALRLSYGAETSRWAPRVRSALLAWRELERERSVRLFHRTGFLALAPRFAPGSFEHESAARLLALGESVEVIGPAAASRRFPGFSFDGIEAAVLDPTGGWLDPLASVGALADSARAAGARIVDRTPIEDVAALDADAVLIAAGGWLPRVSAAPIPVTVTRQTEFLFEPKRGSESISQQLPVWCFDLAGAGHYGFGAHPSGLFKVARHSLGPSLGDLGPDGPPESRAPTATEIAEIESFVAHRLPCLSPRVADVRACQYTMSADGNFLFDEIDRPRAARAPRWFVAGCGSGHAFKFGPLLGDWAADLVEGKPVPPEFRAARGAGARVV